MCVVYVGVDTADNTIPNNELFDLVEEEAKEILCKGNDLCLLGDFNAHIEDDKPDKNGTKKTSNIILEMVDMEIRLITNLN